MAQAETDLNFLAAADDARTRDNLDAFNEEFPPAPQEGQVTPAGGLGAAVVGLHRSGLERVGRATKGVGQAAVEMPLAAVKGVTGAATNMVQSLDDLGNWLNENVADLRIEGGTGIEALDNPLATAAGGLKSLPEISERETTGGRMVQGISQFVTGMGLSNLILPGSGYARTLASGALSDAFAFEADAPNVVQQLASAFPETMQGPIVDALATDEDDPAWQNRLRRAGEGAVSSVVLDGLVKALKVWRARPRKAQVGAPTETTRFAGEAADADVVLERAAIADNDFSKLLGDPSPDAPLVKVPKPLAQAARDVNEADAFGEGAVLADVLPESMVPRLNADDAARLADNAGGPIEGLEINFARIDGPDDIKAAMQQYVRMDKGAVEEARGGVRTWAEVRRGASDLDAFDLLMRRREEMGGSIPTDREQFAMREFWASTMDKLGETAEAAAIQGTPGAQLAFKKMRAIAFATQREVMGIRAETARAFGQWRMMAGPTDKRRQAIAALLDEGTAQGERDLAQAIAVAFRTDPAAVGKMIEKAETTTAMEAVREFWTNTLLSGPKTLVVNPVSNLAVAAHQIAERGVAAHYSQVFGSGEIALDEFAASGFGAIQGFWKAVRLSGNLSKKGTVWRAMGGDETLSLGSMPLDVRPRKISSAGFGINPHSAQGYLADGFGASVNWPGKTLQIQDVLFKTIAYHQEIAAQAVRLASSEVRRGLIPETQLTKRIDELMAAPMPAMDAAAVKQSQLQTLTAPPGGIAQGLMVAKMNSPNLHFIAPFVRVASNIWNYTFERSPLAPASQRWRAEYAAGGSRRDLAMTKLTMGTLATLAAVDLANQGVITGRGPSDPGERQNLERMGWLPYAIRLPDRYFAVPRLAPIATFLGYGADVAQAISDGDFADGFEADPERLIVAATLGVAGQVMDQTFMSGLSDVLQALEDPERHGMRWIQGLAGSASPTVAFEIAKAMDGDMKAAGDVIDAIYKRTPGLSDGLTSVADLWGRTRTHSSGLGQWFDTFVPIRSKPAEAQPIDEEIKRLRYFPNMPSKFQQFRSTGGTLVGLSLSSHPDIYYQYVRLAGNETKDRETDLGLMDTLNLMVKSQNYQELDDEQKIDEIKDTITDFRKAAKSELLETSPKLRRLVEGQAMVEETKRARLAAQSLR